MQGTSNQDESTVMEDYTLTNASLGLLSADGSWNVSLWGKNLSDEDYVSAYETSRDGLFGFNADLGDSRTYGVTVKYTF